MDKMSWKLLIQVLDNFAGLRKFASEHVTTARFDVAGCFAYISTFGSRLTILCLSPTCD